MTIFCLDNMSNVYGMAADVFTNHWIYSWNIFES